MTIGAFSGRHQLGSDGRYRPASAPLCWCGDPACPPGETHRANKVRGADGRRSVMVRPPWPKSALKSPSPLPPPPAPVRHAESEVVVEVLLTVTEAAQWLGRSRAWVMEAVERGVLFAAPNGSIPLDECKRYARERAERGLL